jgi:RNA polymerase sigma factor (sigma-70 family)
MPLTELLRRNIEAEHIWLGRQALFQPDWERGCSAVARSLDAWVEDYAKQLLGTGIAEEIRERCRVRVWFAWAYHWERAVRRASTGQADGMTVADAARSGIRLGHPHPMGGDPFRDAVLVEACLAGLNPALDRFFTEYQATFDQETRRVFHREPDNELWEDLFVKLVGPAPGEGKLAEFKGYSSLRAWLRPVARHFVLDRCRLEQIRRLAERRAALLHTPEATSPDPVELEETVDWCRAQVVRALASLEDRDRLLLLLRFRSGWSGSAIAELLKVHPGHFSRLLGQATERFRLQLESPWEQLFQKYEPSTIGYFLFRGLDEAHAEVPEEDARRLIGGEESIMSTAQEKSKRKPGTKKPAETRGARSKPVSKPVRREILTPTRAKEQPPEVGPEELAQFLPEKVVGVKIGDAPENLFIRPETQPEEQRPAVVCLDAREEADLECVLPWLERFDAVVSEQYEDEARNPYEPHRVVFLSKEAPEPPATWRTRADIDWVQTEDMASDVPALYRLYLQQDLYDFVNEDLEEFFPASPGGKIERLADLIPASKRAAWKARVKEFKEREDEA